MKTYILNHKLILIPVILVSLIMIKIISGSNYIYRNQENVTRVLNFYSKMPLPEKKVTKIRSNHNAKLLFWSLVIEVDDNGEYEELLKSYMKEQKFIFNGSYYYNDECNIRIQNGKILKIRIDNND